MAGWGRRFRIAHPGQRSAHRPAVHLAHVPGAPGRRRLAGGRRLAGRRRMAGGRRHQVRQPRGHRGRASRCSSRATSSARTRGGDGRFRGGPGGELEMVVEIAEPARRQHRRRRRPPRRLRHRSAARTAQPHRYVLRSGGPPTAPLKTKETGIEVRPGRRARRALGRRRRLGRSERCEPTTERARDRRSSAS